MITEIKHRSKGLCFLLEDHGRDLEIVMPMVYFAETYLKVEVEFAHIWDVHAVYRKKPDFIILPNAKGNLLFFEIARYAALNNIVVFAQDSEGNFRTDGTYKKYWGYNSDHVLYQDYLCTWSERTYCYMRETYPTYKDRFVLVGATQFDRYKIYDFQDRESFLQRYSKTQFKKIVGYAGWGFGKIHNAQGRKEISYLHPDADYRENWMRDQRDQVEAILRKTIEANPDTLFVFKRHPNESNPAITFEAPNEMNQLLDYDNVLYFRNDVHVHDLINVADLWMGFETTTSIEAWLLKDMPTLLINPETDFDFPRNQVYKGSLRCKTYEDVQTRMDERFKTGDIADFRSQELKDFRHDLIAESIGFGDGLNHVRTGYFMGLSVARIQNHGRQKVKFEARFFWKYLLLQLGKPFYNKSLFLKLPKFKKTVWIFENHQLKAVPAIKKRYFSYLDRFHQKHDLASKMKTPAFWEEALGKDQYQSHEQPISKAH